MTMLQAALEYAQRGWAVFPVEQRGKRPITSNGCNDATTDPHVIRGWWSRWPNANIGIGTGSASGIYVLDVDVGEGKNGISSLANLEHFRINPAHILSL